MKSGIQSVALSAQASKAPEHLALAMPHCLDQALREDVVARASFERLPASHRRAYLDWIAEAKREETRQRRVSETLSRLKQGRGLRAG